MRSFFALVDLVAVLPAMIGFFGAGDLRVLRLLRLLRMLKLVRHSTTFGLLFAVLREEARSISALLFVLLLTVTISGSLMYMLEGEEQPAVFTSIPAAMWWAIETLTTVGYGDIVPITAVGQDPRRRRLDHRHRYASVVLRPDHGRLSRSAKTYRERHPKVAVAVSRTTITVTQGSAELCRRMGPRFHNARIAAGYSRIRGGGKMIAANRSAPEAKLR